MLHIYNPIIKQKGFDPSPFAGKVPHYADSQTNPKCYGTPEHTAFWDEMFYYCMNGFDTGGIHIPGEYFEYLNFKIIDGPSGPQYPDFIDLHFQLYQASEEIKNDSSILGGVFPKARRKGLSFWGQQKISYGLRYKDRYRAAVAGGLQTFVDGFRSKLYRTYNEVPPELRLNHIIRNTDALVIGYEESTVTGKQRKEEGVVLFKTMKDSGSKLEGEYFNDVVLEELGEFPLAEEAIISISPALMDGDDYVGKIWGFGTGGKMQKGGATFQQIVSRADSLSFKTYFIPGRRMYFPYLVRKDKKVITPNLDGQREKLSPEQMLGCEDVIAAAEAIDKRAKKLAESGDRKNLVQHKQNFPEDLQDVFVSSGSNDFNIEKLFLQKFEIDSNPQRYAEYVLEFRKNKSGELLTPLEVEVRIPTRDDPEWKRVLILKDGMPINGIRDLDIVGIDGYNLDSSSTSKSIGGIIALRRNDKMKILDENQSRGIVPVLVYYKRPPRKEQFWEIGLKVSILYNAIRNTMIGVDSDSMIGYYKDMGCKKYLSPRPKSFESDRSEQTHEFGYKDTTFSIPRRLAAMQSWVEDYVKYCWFSDLVKDLIGYDDVNIGTDYDLADALGHALVRIQDMKRTPDVDMNKIAGQELQMPEWEEDSDGNIVIKSNPYNSVRKNNKPVEEDGGWARM